ncbi:AbgT family transporter [Novilysobacter spongiicola]|uniref:Aminobenzoyl-glutamate transport protein n=2 Tax=Novilysobacter TaxID=3382699 RepID=A0A1T4Q6J3_9GAMM|nr:AbgT family transporter [Lysobacter spongiicola]SJZ99382.1 aminobenzoyl-glutamate transport protein [Lysobacter spongiicola DSM 21749]
MNSPAPPTPPAPTPPSPGRSSAIDRFLTVVERGGNALPHPATLFAILAMVVVLLSWVASQFALSVQHPTTGEIITPVNLVSVDGLHRILTGLVTNFTSFAPLGTVLVSLIGIGVAEHSGLIGAALRQLVLAAPRFLLTPVMVFAGVMSNMASEIGYVLLVPLAGLVFLAARRHPILGMAAAFAGVSGGYSANLLLGTIDPLLAGLSQEAARIIDPAYTVSPAANWYFMIVSTFLVTGLGWWVTERFVARRFPDAPKDDGSEDIEPMSASEKRGLLFALVATGALTALVMWGTIPADGFLRDAETGDLLNSPFLRGIVALIFIYGVVAGVAYGIGAGTIKSDADVINGMGKSMSTLGIYLVLTFFAAQFVAFFNWTQLGLIFAVNGAGLLTQLQLPGVVLFAGFIVLTALANLFMGSASAKWALMAPVFIPMFMLLGYSPELTQIGYRIGDSVTNIISPMMSYFALIIAFLQRYEPKAGIGTVVAVMLPYSMTFLAGWTVLFAIWMAMGWPIGPGSPLEYIPAT